MSSCLLPQPPMLGTGRISKRGGKAARQMAAAGGVALPTGTFVTSLSLSLSLSPPLSIGYLLPTLWGFIFHACSWMLLHMGHSPKLCTKSVTSIAKIQNGWVFVCFVFYFAKAHGQLRHHMMDGLLLMHAVQFDSKVVLCYVSHVINSEIKIDASHHKRETLSCK